MDEQHRMLLLLAVLAVLALLVLTTVLRRARHRARAAYEGTERVSVFGRGLLAGGVIVGGQWVTITYAPHDHTLFWVVLGLPATVAGFTLARLFTVTPAGSRRRGGGHR